MVSHSKDVPEKTIFERSLTQRSKLRRQRLDEVKKTEKEINNELFSHYFTYSSPSNMHSRLGNAKSEINNDQVYLIEKVLTKIQNIIKNVPKDKSFKIEENEKIIYIFERIIELNNENQLGGGLEILTPNQMLSRLPITLTQSKAGNNSEKLKNEIRQLLYFMYRSKKLTKQL